MRRIFTAAIMLLVTLHVAAQLLVDPMQLGAKGDGKTDDAAAIQKAIDQCSEQGGGIIAFSPGHTYLCGPVRLKSNVLLFLAATAVIKANPDESVYHLSAFGANEGEGMLWLYAEGAENIVITGKGTIDGNGVAFMGEELDDSYDLKPVTTFDPRPHVLTLTNVRNVTVRDITIKDGAYWTLHFVGCDEVVVDGINLLNNLKIRNGDGIDIDHSRNVRIANCHITSGDDCICLKNRRESGQYGPCHDIVVTNCVMTSRSCAIKIGSENVDSIYNVLFDNGTCPGGPLSSTRPPRRNIHSTSPTTCGDLSRRAAEQTLSANDSTSSLRKVTTTWPTNPPSSPLVSITG